MLPLRDVIRGHGRFLSPLWRLAARVLADRFCRLHGSPHDAVWFWLFFGKRDLCGVCLAQVVGRSLQVMCPSAPRSAIAQHHLARLAGGPFLARAVRHPNSADGLGVLHAVKCLRPHGRLGDRQLSRIPKGQEQVCMRVRSRSQYRHARCAIAFSLWSGTTQGIPTGAVKRTKANQSLHLTAGRSARPAAGEFCR